MGSSAEVLKKILSANAYFVFLIDTFRTLESQYKGVFSAILPVSYWSMRVLHKLGCMRLSYGDGRTRTYGDLGRPPQLNKAGIQDPAKIANFSDF